MSETAILEKLQRLEELIVDKTHDRWIGMKDAVRYTGLSEATLRRAIQSRKLKASKQTGKIMFRISWLDDFLIG